MQVDDPPFLSVGTAVSAKYKGAFCEAKVSKVDHTVKCKVTYKMGLGSATILDNDIKGTLRVGQLVQAKHPDRKEMVEATITKIQDCSMYTVVFDDGDITTLRRSALCLKSGRHFNESETLDQLPLTHPEHFGNPVVGGRRGRRNRQMKDESSEEEAEEEAEPEDLEEYSRDIGRVITVEGEKKRGKDGSFPGLVVVPSAQPTVRINVKDEFLVRSFRDGRYYTVPKKEVQEFEREASGISDTALADAVKRAVEFLDEDKLPPHWERGTLFNIAGQAGSDSEGDLSESSDDEQSEEKDRFVAQLYKFMDDAGTPLNKTPTVAGKDVDLHRLFRVVQKLGGHNRVTNQNKWRAVAGRMKLPTSQNAANQVRSVYKKCLSSFEAFNRTLGVTMLNHTRSSKKSTNRGRSLIRDKDRNTPIQSPRPDKEEEEKEERERPRRKMDKEKEKEKDESVKSDTNSDATDHSEAPSVVAGVSGRPKRTEVKTYKARVAKAALAEKMKAIAEKMEEAAKEEEKGQQTRSKTQYIPKQQQREPPVPKKEEPKPSKEPSTSKLPKIPKKITSSTPPVEDEKKRGRKRTLTEEKSDTEAPVSAPLVTATIGDKLKVFYGPTNESKVTYEAKVIEIDKDSAGPIYLVHYTGWNTRYDEWIPGSRIAENLSASTKAKRVKQSASLPSVPSKVSSGKIAAKRGRGASVSGKSTSEGPRSTTPSSINSGSSRTKSPGTPATRSGRLTTRQDSRKHRRTSAQTDNSAQSDSNSDSSESEPELTRTRSGSKAEEPEVRTYRRKPPLAKPMRTVSPKLADLRKDGDDTEKEEEEKEKPVVQRRMRKMKKMVERSESEDEVSGRPTGRDFDLNQIRSELKGFTKSLKVSLDSIEKDPMSSSDDSTNPAILEKPDEKVEPEEKEPSVEKSTSSEDVYEFKEPEPFEFESRKVVDDKTSKKRLPRIFDELEKSPRRRAGRSPGKGEVSPGRPTGSFRRSGPLARQDDSDEEVAEKKEDPFDKLVESPSFNLGKPTTKESPVIGVASAVVDKLPTPPKPKPPPTPPSEDPPLALFGSATSSTASPPHHEPSETITADLSDTDSKSAEPAPFQLTTGFIQRPPSERSTTNDMEFSSERTDEGKTTNSDDDDTFTRAIQRAIKSSSTTDEDSDDGPLASRFMVGRKEDADEEPLAAMLGITTTPITSEPSTSLLPPKEKSKSPSPPPTPKEKEPEKEDKPPPAQIDPALQETDSSLLESIVSQPPILLNRLEETAKEIPPVKTGTKIADSLLQKFKSLEKSKVVKSPKSPKSPKVEENVEKIEVKPVEVKVEEVKKEVEVKKKEEIEEVKEDVKLKEVESNTKVNKIEEVVVEPVRTSPEIVSHETKKRKRVLSKQFIDESDSDSSDSEQLFIAKSDDDSQATVTFDKSESKTDIVNTTDDSQMEIEEIEYKYEVKIEETVKIIVDGEEMIVKEKISLDSEVRNEEIIESEREEKEEEDQGLHSMLLCEEEIPRSPAPLGEPESPEPEHKPQKTSTEMPFASAPPGGGATLLLEAKKAQVAAVLVQPEKVEEKTERPSLPSTPESTVSNFSPRGDNGGASPNAATNDSTKSNESENEFTMQRRNSGIKVSPYSEEDTQMVEPQTSSKKAKEEGGVTGPSTCRKRRKSLRGSEDSASAPSKRGRKPLNTSKSRRDSDSEDNDESNSGVAGTVSGSRANRSPRPSKYNFYVEFDPALDSGQRIAILQQKISDLRKAYADVKAELAVVERRRKKIRRREREALKAAKQEVACA